MRLAFPVPLALFNELKQRATKPPILRGFDQVGPAGLFGGGDRLGVLTLFLLLETDGFLFLVFPPTAFGLDALLLPLDLFLCTTFLGVSAARSSDACWCSGSVLLGSGRDFGIGFRAALAKTSSLVGGSGAFGGV